MSAPADSAPPRVMTGAGSTAFGSISSGGFALRGQQVNPPRPTSKSRTITRGADMTRPAIHPSEILVDELEELGISATALSRALHVPTNRITQIINGQRAITAETAF